MEAKTKTKLLKAEDYHEQEVAELEQEKLDFKRAEEALRESEGKYRSLVENSNDGIVIVQGRRIVFANKVVKEISGYSEEELKKLSFIKLIAPSSRSAVVKRYFARLAGLQVKNRFEIEVLTKEGKIIPCEISSSAITYHGKNAIQATLTDITERKRVAEALRKSEGKYRKQFEEALDAIFIADAATGIIVDCNHAACELVGKEKSELVGKHQRELHPPGKIGGEFTKTFKQHQKEKEGQVLETQVITKKGEIKDVAIKASSFELEGKKVLLGIFRDITERKRAEEALRESEERFHSISDTAGEAIISTDSRGNIVYWNKTAEKIFGYSADAVIDKSVTIIIPEQYRKLFSKGLEEVVSTGTTSLVATPIEGAGLRKDGGMFPCDFSLADWEMKGERFFTTMVRDITERKRAEEELLRLSNAVKMSTDSIVISDLEGKIIEANEATLKMYGTDDKGDVIGKNSLDLIAPEDREKAFAGMEKVRERGYTQNREYHIITKDGSRILVEMNSAIMKDVDGKAIGFVGTSRDITERKQAEETLRESEEKYRELFENATDGIFTLDLRGRFTSGNKKAEEICGYQRGQLLGKHFINLLPKKEIPHMLNVFQKVLRGKTNIFGTKLKTKSGDLVPVEITTTVVKEDGKPIGTLGMVRDITEQKRAEETLRESEERYRTTFENTGTAMAIIEEDTIISLVNSQFEKLAKYSKEEIEGKKRWMEFVHQEDLERMKKYHRERREPGGETPTEYEFRFVDKEGNMKNIFLLVQVIPRTKKSITSLMDITEQKRAEEQLEHSFVDLAETVSRAMSSRDPYTASHQRRVAELARLVGEKMGLDKDRIQGLYIGGLLHDIGKISTPETILSKPGDLTEEEWGILHAHAKQGYKILKDTELPWPVADMAVHHHERLDGSGYPHGISGDKLSLEVRILGVCDVVEAMSSHRPYRPAKSKREVLGEIKRGRGTKYDAHVVDIVLQIIKNGEFEFGWGARSPHGPATKVPAL